MFIPGQLIYCINEDTLEIETCKFFEKKYNSIAGCVIYSAKHNENEPRFFSKDEIGIIVFESRDEADKGLITFKKELLSERLMLAFNARKKAEAETESIMKTLESVNLADESTLMLLIEYFSTGSPEHKIKLLEKYQHKISEKEGKN